MRAKAEETRAGPAGAGDGKGDLGQAAIGGAVPDKALMEDDDALGSAVPLPHQGGAGLKAVPAVSGFGESVSLPITRCDPVEEALSVAVEIAKMFSLQAVGEHAIEKMSGQMVGGLAAKDRLPSCPQAGEVEIAQARDLVLQFTHRGHDQAARRDVVFDDRREPGPGMR